AKDIQIQVRELKPVGKAHRLKLDADVSLRGWAEVQHWVKGLATAGFVAEADTRFGLYIECEFAITLDTKKFPPDIKVDPKVTDLKMEVKDFTRGQIASGPIAIVLEGQAARVAGDQVKGLLQDLVRSREPNIKDLANEAIARAVRDGKGTFSAESLLKAL